MKNTQAVVVGIDGLTKSFIDNHRQHLPNFNRLREEGEGCLLKSVVPVLSPVAWASLVTGVNPGKHGIYDFQQFDGRKLVSSFDIGFPTIWDRLTEANLKSIVVNVPLTYPPSNINGKMISGLLTPSTRSEFTTPRNLKEVILRKGYRIGLEPQKIFELFLTRSDHQMLNLLHRAESIRTDIFSDLFSDLLKKEDYCHFAMIVFQELDKIQHFYWRQRQILKLAYQIYDKLVGQILEICETRDLFLFIVSDHGFEKVDNYVFVNKILEREDLLKCYESKTHFKWRTAGISLDRVSSNLRSVVGKMIGVTPSHLKNAIMDKLIGKQEIDFEHSKVVGGFSTGPHVPLKVVRGNKEKLRRRVIDIFLRVKDHNKRVVDKIYSKQELYCGPFIDLAPDFVLVLKKGYIGHPSVRPFLPDVTKVDNIPIWMRRYGDHDEHAIFLTYRPHGHRAPIAKDEPSILDVTPTLYKILHLSPDPELDGRPLF